jgi:zinc transport system substrate-binding protein
VFVHTRVPALFPRLLAAILAPVLASILALFLVLALPGPSQAQEAPRVLTGTTLIEDILADLAQGALTLRTLIPAAACPGHADLKTSDALFFQQARAVLLHDWQERMPMIRGLLATGGRPDGLVRTVPAPGNWMLPEAQARATEALAAILQELLPDRAAAIEERAKARLERVRAVDARLRALARDKGLAGRPAICDAMQRPFLEWLGLDVVADYGRFEEMNPERLAQAMTVAKARRAVRVADNMQSTAGAGQGLAQDLAAAHVVLTNFPGVTPAADTWEKALEWNVAQVVSALESRQ